MANKVKGIVTQFGSKGYGFITGEDDKKYFVHQKSTVNKSRLKVNTAVIFNAKHSDKGWVATDVELQTEAVTPTVATTTALGTGSKILFAILLLTQAVLVYQVFFASANS